MGGEFYSVELCGYALDDYLNDHYPGYPALGDTLLAWFRAHPETTWIEISPLAKELELPQAVVRQVLLALASECQVELGMEHDGVVDVSPEIFR
jgi:hypothetical protein